MTIQNLPTAAAPTPTSATPNTSLTRVQNPREWTRGKQAEFLRQLAATHCVSTAARSVGMARQSAYRLRNRLKGQPFDIAWACAFRRQFDALAEAALDRAMNGVEVPHYYRDELVGTHRVFNETLTLGLLARHYRLTPIPPDRHAEQYGIAPDDFEALVERVACGDELWADDVGRSEGWAREGATAAERAAGQCAFDRARAIRQPAVSRDGHWYRWIAASFHSRREPR